MTVASTLRSSELGRYDRSELPAAGTYRIDKSHSSIEFLARHLMLSKVRGRFGEFEGTITVAENPQQSSVEVSIDPASITTGDDTRDGHLRSADFFDVENHLGATFRSTSVTPGPDPAHWQVTGELTLRGVTHPVVLDVEFEGAGTDPWGGARIGFSASAEVDREDWGLVWNQALETGGVLVGRKVRLVLDVQATRV